MAFQEMNMKLQYRKLALWEKGDTITGKYLKMREAGEYKGNMQYQAVIELTEDCDFNDYKDQPLVKGSKFGMALPTSLIEYFDESNVGNLFQVKYKGKVPNKSGDNSYHDFAVGMDDGSEVETAPDEEDYDL